ALPEAVRTDEKRLQQVVLNLLSNAFKFTAEGRVVLELTRAKSGNGRGEAADESGGALAISVIDTGIGIPEDKQKLIFEAFQQADGTTSRRFGGTGLGLSISREIARLLGGEIRVESTPEAGSTFTLFLPAKYTEVEQAEDLPGSAAARADRRRRLAVARGGATRTSGETPLMDPELPTADSLVISGEWHHDRSDDADAESYTVPQEDLPRPEGFDDDRDLIAPGDRVVLIIENDTNFAKILLDMARERGFRGLAALEGRAGLQLAHAYEPDAITLDIDMPGMDGWEVLDRLKHHPATRHIPVHIITGVAERQEGLKQGAIAYLEKPVSQEDLDQSFTRIATFIDTQVKRLLVVEDDDTQRNAIVELVAHEDVEIKAVGTAEEALRELEESHYDCMVLDLGLAEISGFELLEKVKSDPARRELPIIIYTGRELTQEEETILRKYAETIIIKDVKSPERLLDETALFLHRVESKLPEQKRRMLERLHTADAAFAGKHVLVVDDDVRNIYSLTSMLEDQGMTVSFAENGRDAIEQVEGKKGIDIVLMDVMMPEMDGYETTRAIRQIPELKSLPIIALTAKAMKGDREKCIAAGASDYITKPVDVEQLLSLMRVWLYR
ncbi:MAG: response regulator, partial [Gemmatimonadaceae bacterium]|nr:response regulator [Gemmatimonadaceae bacterium]